MENEFEELNKNELEQFEKLAREEIPPRFLEERIINSLKKARMIHSSKRNKTWSFLKLSTAVAALLLFFVFGALVGVYWFSQNPTIAVKNDLPQFILLLRSSPEQQKETSNDEIMQRIKEYSEWAKATRGKGFLLEGEKLKDEINILAKPGGQLKVSGDEANAIDKAIEGYFVIRANNYEQAVAIAESCPHLKYGGRIEVREIDRF